MKVHSGVGLLILVGVTVLCMALFIAGAWAYLHLEPTLADQKLHAEMKRLQSAALVYKRQLSDFDGVCKEIGVRLPFECNQSSIAFAISVERHDGSFYCADSSGYFDIQVLPIRDHLSCKPNGP